MERFCHEYIIDLNASQACIRAGYSKKTSGEMGYENLKKPQIQERIKELLKERESRTEITADMVIQELGKLAFSDIRKLYDGERLLLPHELDDTTASTISSFKTRREGDAEEGFYEVEEYKRYSKDKSLELLGRHFGLFDDRLKIEGTLDLAGIAKARHDRKKNER